VALSSDTTGSEYGFGPLKIAESSLFADAIAAIVFDTATSGLAPADSWASRLATFSVISARFYCANKRRSFKTSFCDLRLLAVVRAKLGLTLVSEKTGEERVYRIGACPERLEYQSLPNQGSLAQRAGEAKRGSISRACSAIAISAEPPNTTLMPTSSPIAQAAVPGRPVRMIVAKIRSRCRSPASSPIVPTARACARART
jgi:hypothetical protein